MSGVPAAVSRGRKLLREKRPFIPNMLPVSLCINSRGHQCFHRGTVRNKPRQSYRLLLYCSPASAGSGNPEYNCRGGESPLGYKCTAHQGNYRSVILSWQHQKDSITEEMSLE